MPNQNLRSYDEVATTTDKSGKGSKNSLQQVFVQQSVTILAFKDKTNGTLPSDSQDSHLFLGFLSKDLPVFVGALIGAAIILVLFLLILTIWKCCHRMHILRKKKYWLHSKDRAKPKTNHLFSAVVQSNSVVFLGLKQTQAQEFKKMENSVESSPSIRHEPLVSSYHDVTTEAQHALTNSIVPAPSHGSSCPLVIISSDCATINDLTSLPITSVTIPPSPSNANYVNCNLPTHHQNPPDLRNNELSVFSMTTNNPSVISHCGDSLQSSPAFVHRGYYSGTFDQQSLYSCQSHIGSELDLKTCNFTWSNYSLRPSSTGDCYYDLFQRASLCKKRKNRMRSDIAAAIALNRSQSTNLNKEKDTDSLVENEVEIVLDERTPL